MLANVLRLPALSTNMVTIGAPEAVVSGSSLFTLSIEIQALVRGVPFLQRSFGACLVERPCKSPVLRLSRHAKVQYDHYLSCSCFNLVAESIGITMRPFSPFLMVLRVCFVSFA
jgi:hypothetical protein